MGRQLWLGMVLAGVMVPSAWPEAAGAPAAGSTRFTLKWVENEPTLRVEGRGVTLVKRVGRDKVSLRVEVTGDRIELDADTRGAVRVSRQGKAVAVHMSDAFELNIARIQKLTAGSKALDAFEGLVASLASDDSANAQSVRSSHALLSVVRGVTIPMAPAPVRSTAKLSPAGLTLTAGTEGPFACWAEYASTVDQYLVQFNSCIDSYWWIPGWTSACSFQFVLQAELAWFWLISCSGGMPV